MLRLISKNPWSGKSETDSSRPSGLSLLQSRRRDPSTRESEAGELQGIKKTKNKQTKERQTKFPREPTTLGDGLFHGESKRGMCPNEGCGHELTRMGRRNKH